MGSYPNIQHRSSAHWAINRHFSYLPLRLTNNNRRGVWKSHSNEPEEKNYNILLNWLLNRDPYNGSL